MPSIRYITAVGVDRALLAMRSTLADGKTLGDDRAIGEHLDALERDGYTEISRHLTASGRPEIVVASDDWFDCGFRTPGYPGPCPDGMGQSEWLAFNNVD